MPEIELISVTQFKELFGNNTVYVDMAIPIGYDECIIELDKIFDSQLSALIKDANDKQSM